MKKYFGYELRHLNLNKLFREQGLFANFLTMNSEYVTVHEFYLASQNAVNKLYNVWSVLRFDFLITTITLSIYIIVVSSNVIFLIKYITDKRLKYNLYKHFQLLKIYIQVWKRRQPTSQSNPVRRHIDYLITNSFNL